MMKVKYINKKKKIWYIFKNVKSDTHNKKQTI